MRFRIDVKTLDGKLSTRRYAADALEVAEGGKQASGSDHGPEENVSPDSGRAPGIECDTAPRNQTNRARLCAPKGAAMRIAIIALCLGLSTGVAFAQTTPPPTKDSPNTTGRTVIPEKKEAQPLDTKSSAGRRRPVRRARRLRDAVGSRGLVQADEIAASRGRQAATSRSPASAASRCGGCRKASRRPRPCWSAP